MYEIDHIPVGSRDLSQLAAVFEALGFNVSGVCHYHSPDLPSERWTCRAVFLEHGWLDLQSHPDRPADQGAAPHSCLFRAPSLLEAASELTAFRMGPVARLVQRWEGQEAPSLRLSWMSVRERIAPLVLALVEYPDEKELDPGALSHPNSVQRIRGLTFGDAAPGPAAEAAAGRLALSGFEYLPRQEFAQRFGTLDGPMVALRFEAASLEQAASCLRRSGLRFSRAGDAITVPAQGPLACGVEFTPARQGTSLPPDRIR